MDALEFARRRILAGTHRIPLPAPTIARAGHPPSPAGFRDLLPACGAPRPARCARTRA